MGVAIPSHASRETRARVGRARTGDGKRSPLELHGHYFASVRETGGNMDHDPQPNLGKPSQSSSDRGMSGSAAGYLERRSELREHARSILGALASLETPPDAKARP